MSEKKLSTLLKEMGALRDKHISCRAVFPFVPKTLIGKKGPFAAPYYEQFGFSVKLDFGRCLTTDDLDRINTVGHYLNQNFVVRLCALLESYQIFSDSIKIDQSMTSWKSVDILRRLRNRFAHSSGKYDPEDVEQKKLYDKLINHFDLSDVNAPDFPLPINEVLMPMFRDCEEYVKKFMEKNGRE